MMMLSRIADSLFWIGAVHGAGRQYGAHSGRELSHAAGAAAGYVQTAVGSADRGDRRADAGSTRRYEEASAQTAFEFLGFSEENPNSIWQCIVQARENARTIRDRISRELWEDINSLYHKIIRLRDEGEASPVSATR